MDLNKFLKKLEEEVKGKKVTLVRRGINEDYQDDWIASWNAHTVCGLGDWGDGVPKQTLLYWPTFRKEYIEYEKKEAGLEDGDDDVYGSSDDENYEDSYISGSGPWVLTGLEDVGGVLYPSLTSALEAYVEDIDEDDEQYANFANKIIALNPSVSGTKLLSMKLKNLKNLYNALKK